MKQIIHFIMLAILFSFLNSCGYEPIYSSVNLNIKFENKYIDGDKQLGNKIYSRLKEQFLISDNARKVNLYVAASSNKSVTSQSSTGKALEYKITVNAAIKITDFTSNQVLIEIDNTSSQNYKVQDRLFETEKLENKTIDNLIDKISQGLIIKISNINKFQ